MDIPLFRRGIMASLRDMQERYQQAYLLSARERGTIPIKRSLGEEDGFRTVVALPDFIWLTLDG